MRLFAGESLNGAAKYEPLRGKLGPRHDALTCQAEPYQVEACQDKSLSEVITRNADATLDVAQGVVDHRFDLKVRFERRRPRINRAAESATNLHRGATAG